MQLATKFGKIKPLTVLDRLEGRQSWLKEGLTEAETRERERLRREYIKNFREAMRSNIEMMRIFDKEGKEVTPEKVREIQRKKGLRDD